MSKRGNHIDKWLGILTIAMALGTSWAIRGQFGHEQGAAWAGGIGTLVLVLVSQREDWYSKVLPVILSSAFGWGLTGMISYGRVVGYGRSDDLVNVFYGLSMLFVIGGLFGLIGGGFTALSLESTKNKKVNWPSLIVEMTAGALVVYGLLVMQLEVLMTPPRSEAWALSLGAGLAMVWYMLRNGFLNSFRVAFYTALGAGFGFAFGNFLQTVGTVLELPFNMWNVMEYCIGFFGGGSMAYAIFASEWPISEKEPQKWENSIAFLAVFVCIPVIIFRESLQMKNFLSRFHDFDKSGDISLISTILSALFIVLAVLFIWLLLRRVNFKVKRQEILWVTTIYFGLYIILSFLVTGIVSGRVMLNHILYVANLAVILKLIKKSSVEFFAAMPNEKKNKYYLRYLVLLLFVVSILSLISVGIHGEMAGAHNRFG
ncbi:hypothetical protein GM418_27655 [Maribellus comscasis]|uniref:Uncharacterized protein n=1 Tax=Maribellus comscasis TaxID=2681766 RepID=A0A6I6JVW6_9BACT|nr:hypothetical protein [Maribellus comscasis]QGY47305.1 hypothetical protein GM418_27655 [Maribellus comscasis]